jgi:hypothetical protein
MIPIATNENIVTDRTTEGAKPARIPKENKQHRIISNLIKEPRFVLGMGFNKSCKIKIKPICNPDTDMYGTSILVIPNNICQYPVVVPLLKLLQRLFCFMEVIFSKL